MTNTLVLDPPLIRSSVTVPHTLELTVLFNEFMAYWAGLKTEVMDWGLAQPSSKPVEFIVRWNGSVKGALVIRSSERLMDKLRSALQEKGKDFDSRTAVFQEMVTLYSIFLINSMWMDDLFNLGPLMARPCGAQDRPPMTQSHSFCAIGVEREPVEIRLWLDPAGDPYSNWAEKDIEP